MTPEEFQWAQVVKHSTAYVEAKNRLLAGDEKKGRELMAAALPMLAEATIQYVAIRLNEAPRIIQSAGLH